LNMITSNDKEKDKTIQSQGKIPNTAPIKTDKIETKFVEPTQEEIDRISDEIMIENANLYKRLA